MAKRKITVTVDEELIDAVQLLGSESVSGVVNAALAAEVDRRARAAALSRMLDDWDAKFGSVSAEAREQAAREFDELDALIDQTDEGNSGRQHGAA